MKPVDGPGNRTYNRITESDNLTEFKMEASQVEVKIINEEGEHTATFTGFDDEGFACYTLNFEL
jgi:hypothetical protein